MGTDDTSQPRVLDVLRQDLVDGVYHPRERLIEAELAARYAVTRAAIRTALLTLAAEGLVEREVNRGARVKHLTIAEAIELVEIRQILERLCAGRAAHNATADDRERLTTLVATMQTAVETGNTALYMAANDSFHEAVRDMADHDTARSILAELRNHNLNRHFPMAFTNTRPIQSLNEHQRVVTAIVNGDSAAATQAMHDHLASLLQVLQTYRDSTESTGRTRPVRPT